MNQTIDPNLKLYLKSAHMIEQSGNSNLPRYKAVCTKFQSYHALYCGWNEKDVKYLCTSELNVRLKYELHPFNNF